MDKDNIIVPDEEQLQEETENTDKNKFGKKKEKELLQRIDQLSAENVALIEKVNELEKLADENKQSWYRTAADFENFKKRNNETRANAYHDGKWEAIKNILIVGDNLDRALLSLKDEQTKIGIELVIKQFVEILKSMGVEEINPVGEIFDPNIHEAIHQIENDNPEESGKIQSVFKKGYSLNGKMIRYAQVVVIK